MTDEELRRALEESWKRARPAFAMLPFVEPFRAVLPFANPNGDPAREYFADGITDALISELARLEAVRVISRQSVLHLKGSSRQLDEIARRHFFRGLTGCGRRLLWTAA